MCGLSGEPMDSEATMNNAAALTQIFQTSAHPGGAPCRHGHGGRPRFCFPEDVKMWRRPRQKLQFYSKAAPIQIIQRAMNLAKAK